MKKTKHTVALLYGGRGFEHDVSLIGAKRLFPQIDTERYYKLPILITQGGIWLTSGITDGIPPLDESAEGLFEVLPATRNGKGGFLTENGFIPIDALFPLLHGDFGEDGIIAGALENAMIPYVGQDTPTGALLSDKAYTKAFAEHLGIPTVPWIYAVNEPADTVLEKAKASLGFPLFIKPSRLGSSVGAGIVTSPDSFASVYEKAFTLGSGRVLVEKAVKIKAELECAYFGTKSKELFTKVGEISTGGGFYDYDAKYGGNCPFEVRDSSDIPEAIQKRIDEASRLLVKGIGIRDLARIDFFLAEDGSLFFNEINPMPGFTEKSLYMRLLANEGLPEAAALNSLIEAAISRSV